jgi:hypothetical protein
LILCIYNCVRSFLLVEFSFTLNYCVVQFDMV